MRHLTIPILALASASALAGNGSLYFSSTPFTAQGAENFESFGSYPATARHSFSEGDTIFGGLGSLSWPITGLKDPYTNLDYVPYELGGVSQYRVSGFTYAPNATDGFAKGDGSYWAPDGWTAGAGSPNYVALGVDMNPVAQPLRITFNNSVVVKGFGGLFGNSGIGGSQPFTVTLYDLNGDIIGLDQDPLDDTYIAVNGLNRFELTPGTWGYLGWYSSKRIGAIEFTGNAPVLDNLIITSVPEPGTIAALGAGAALLLRRRRAKK